MKKNLAKTNIFFVSSKISDVENNIFSLEYVISLLEDLILGQTLYSNATIWQFHIVNELSKFRFCQIKSLKTVSMQYYITIWMRVKFKHWIR